jgi:hypothetical protein
VTEIWLRAEGVSKKKAHEYRAFPIAAVEREWRETIPARGSAPEQERQKRIGGLLDRWEVRPPHSLAPPAAHQRAPLLSSEDAQRRARALAPDDTTEDELALLVLDLEEGRSDNQALDAFETRRWRRSHLREVQPLC